MNHGALLGGPHMSSEFADSVGEMQREMERLINPIGEMQREMAQQIEFVAPMIDLHREMDRVVNQVEIEMQRLAGDLVSCQDMAAMFIGDAWAQGEMVGAEMGALSMGDCFKRLETPLAETLTAIEGIGLDEEEVGRILGGAVAATTAAFDQISADMDIEFLTTEHHLGLFSWRGSDAVRHDGFILPEVQRGDDGRHPKVRLTSQAICKFCGERLLADEVELDLIADSELLISITVVPLCISCSRRSEEEPGWYDETVERYLGVEAAKLRGLDGGEEGDGVGVGNLVLVSPLCPPRQRG